MLSVSSKWARALTASHGLSTKVNVLYNGAIVAQDIPFVDGTVKVDRGSETRRSLSLTIAEPSKFPTTETATYGVYGQQIYVERGIRYLDGSTERVPLGTFVITKVSGNIHTGPLTIEAAGREILLKRALFDAATSTKGYISAASFIRTQIQNTVSGADFVDRSTAGAGSIATKTWDAGTDVWSALSEVATSIGAELFCDAYGTYTMVDIPQVANVPVTAVWDVSAGESGVMVSADVALSADDVYNKVTVTGENAEDNKPPVSGSATITAANDPLRYGGPFGKVTFRYSSSLVTNASQAVQTATALLAKKRQANRSVTLEAIPNPALDAGDWIRVNYGPAMLPELHLVNSFEIPLSVSGGSCTIDTVGGHDDDQGAT
ncbi:DUF5047 domain-containing protein [Streptomyces sp. NRRL S-475]|uniref:DUF5047 domain-containing protein n=1 Tax=Streptomyces sp. NRRL S-475 TaxID=1463910 RepID=UPI0004BDA7A1|nr:DUF5047 domain-containing protein [Streptomyces sp. NRRL S-475]